MKTRVGGESVDELWEVDGRNESGEERQEESYKIASKVSLLVRILGRNHTEFWAAWLHRQY